MKRFFSIVLITLLVVSLLLVGTVCVFSLIFVPANPVLESLPVFTEKEVFSSDGFQDITVYAKYHYYAVAPTVLEGNEYFQPVTDADLSELLSYLEDFETLMVGELICWIEVLSIVVLTISCAIGKAKAGR